MARSLNRGKTPTTPAQGPHGLVRTPSWSPDGKPVVHHRLLSFTPAPWQKAWSRNPNYDLVNTMSLPAFDPSGKRLIVTSDKTTLVQMEIGRSAEQIIFRQEGTPAALAQSADWFPKGDAILLGLGQFFRNRAQGAQVAMIKPDGSGLHEITSGLNNNVGTKSIRQEIRAEKLTATVDWQIGG